MILSQFGKKSKITHITNNIIYIIFFTNILVKFYIAEVMNLANAIGQFFFTDYFLSGHFKDVGFNGLFLNEHESVMPIVASCSFTM